MTRILVWDLPTRLFHWLLAGSFVGAFLIANLFDDEGGLFPVHMLLGLFMALLVVLRLAWGLVGSKHARLSALLVGPAALVGYVRDALAGRDRRTGGHNPAAALATVLIFALVLGLAATGVAMGQGWGELFEEVHEALAWALAGTVAAHLAGIAWHTLRHEEPIALSMVTGRKDGPAQHAIGSARPLAGLAFLALAGLGGGSLVQGYDAARRQVTLPGLGWTLDLGEAEGGEHGEHGEHGGGRGGLGAFEDEDDDD